MAENPVCVILYGNEPFRVSVQMGARASFSRSNLNSREPNYNTVTLCVYLLSETYLLQSNSRWFGVVARQ